MTGPTKEERKELDRAIAEMEETYSRIPKARDREDFQWLITGSAIAALDELHAKALKVYELEKKIYLLSVGDADPVQPMKGFRERIEEKALSKALNEGF